MKVKMLLLKPPPLTPENEMKEMKQSNAALAVFDSQGAEMGGFHLNLL